MGLEFWRVKNEKGGRFGVVKETKKDHSASGKLYSGDCYIILHTKKRGEAFERDIFFWLGKDSSQDERGVAAYKTIELDESLGGEPTQHREVEGHETSEFLDLFKALGGLKYMEGGYETGFVKVDRDAFTVRLLHVKGRRHITTRQVPLEPKSMNSGDVFILDAGPNIFQWNGAEASRLEKAKALDVTRKIRDEERGGKAKIHLVDQGGDEDAFWKASTMSRPAKINPATDDAAHEKAVADQIKLFEVSDASGSMTQTEITDRPLTKEMLKTEESYILSTGPAGVFVWAGSGSTSSEKAQAMQRALDFLKAQGLPDYTPVTRLHEGGETPLFKQNFSVWPEQGLLPNGGLGGGAPRRSKFQKKTFDVGSILQQQKREKALLPDDGSGKTTVWRLEKRSKVEITSDKLKGQFYAGDSYIVLYEYKEASGRDAAFIYYWQGLKSSQDEKADSAILSMQLDEEMGGYPVQCRVVMNKEPAHFMKIFEKRMVVHHGGVGSGFKNVDEADEYDTDGTRLFHVRGTNDYNTRAIQVAERAASLNSGDCFILETPEKLFLWFGTGANGDEREFTKSIVPRLQIQSKDRDPALIMEGKEPEEFWAALGGKTAYGKVDYADADVKDARLFQCSDARGYFFAEEIFDFDQEDLIPEDVMMLDTWREIFIWVGSEAKPNEKADALKMAMDYVGKSEGRTIDDTPMMVVKQGREPPNFTIHFHAWDDAKFGDGRSAVDVFEEEKAKLLASNPSGDMAEVLKSSFTAEVAKSTVGGVTYAYADLTKPADQIDKSVDQTQKEQYLSDEEFGQYFKKPDGSSLTKAEFNSMPKWKQLGLKKKAKLF